MIPRLLYSKLSEKNNTLDKKQIHYLKNVLRLKTGDKVILFDGKGNESYGNIIIDKSRNVSLNIKNSIKVNRETSIKITVAQALCLSNKMDFVVQKSTELGVYLIQPIMTTRCHVKIHPSKVADKTARWQRVANAASAQCGRNVNPKVLNPISWYDFIASANKKNIGTSKLLLDPFTEESISQVKLTKGNDLIMVIGPEAGLTDNEEEMATNSNFIRVKCGNRILRTETASIVALSIINSRLEVM